MPSLSDVLSEARLEQYKDKLIDEGYELEDLLESNTIEDLDEILQEAGIEKKAHRLRLRRKLWKMKTGNSNANQGNSNQNQNKNNDNINNTNNSNSNNNVSDEILKMRQEMEAMKLRYEMEKLQRQQKREEEEEQRKEEERKRKEEEKKKKEQESQKQSYFDSNFDFDSILKQNLQNNQQSNNNNNSKFPVIFDEGDNTVTFYNFEKSDLVKVLFKRYAKKLFQSDDDRLLTRFNLSYGSTQLTSNDWNKRLDNIGMGSNPQGEFVNVIADVDGGSRRSKVRSLKKNSGYTIVKGECCILKLEDECAKMKCGHLISAFAMYNYIKSVIEKNMHIHRILCPVPKCGQQWDWNTCCLVGDLSQDEYIGYTAIIKRREKVSSGAFKFCPFCKVLIKRPDKLGMNRVKCSKCKSADFCYICTKKWSASGFTLCGNDDCSLYEKQRKLLNCAKIKKDNKHTYDYYDTLDIPIYRACPKCYRFIQHKSACKHMDCPGCGLKFCFICLGIYENGKWPCMLNGDNTDHSLGCNLAPRQKLG